MKVELGAESRGIKEGEEWEETNGRKNIPVEVKFTCIPFEGRFNLRETHRRWERELSLSCNGLDGSVIDYSLGIVFWESRRKETTVIDGVGVSLIEGSNSKGCFLPIQVLKGRKDSIFLVVPARFKGCQWGRVSQHLRDTLEGTSGFRSKILSPQLSGRKSFGF